MKHRLLIPILIIFLLSLSGCECKHEWTQATCISPNVCSLCSETEGELGDHTWNEASCTAPQICSICEATQGSALGHNWQDATCSAPQTCQRCGETQGESLAHTPGEPVATYDVINLLTNYTDYCTVCGEEIATYTKRTESYVGEDAFALNAEEFVTRINHVFSTRDTWVTQFISTNSQRTSWTAELETMESDGETAVRVNLICDGITYGHIEFYVPFPESEEYTNRIIRKDETTVPDICAIRVYLNFLEIAMQLNQTEDVTSQEEFNALYRSALTYYSEQCESLLFDILYPIYKSFYPPIDDLDIEYRILTGYQKTQDFLSTDLLFEEQWGGIYHQYINLLVNKVSYYVNFSVSPDILFNP